MDEDEFTRKFKKTLFCIDCEVLYSVFSTPVFFSDLWFNII